MRVEGVEAAAVPRAGVGRAGLRQVVDEVVARQAQRKSPVDERVARGRGPDRKDMERGRRVGPDHLDFLFKEVGLVRRRGFICQSLKRFIDLVGRPRYGEARPVLGHGDAPHLSDR